MKIGELPELEPAYARETRRIREVYAKVRQQPCIDQFGRCAVHEREERLVSFLLRKRLGSLEGLKILDVGCGGGALLRRLFDLGAEPQDCFGIDVMGNLLQAGRRLAPANLSLVECTATQLPFPDQVFDVAFQFTMFSSVLDPVLRRAIMTEILRTLRGGGYFIWYDFTYSNPRNKTVTGIGRREIKDLLNGCKLEFYRVTLAPPIGRVAARWSPTLYHLLSSVCWLRTHYLCCAEKAPG
ncbi:MAG: class I SAM-dependent methyltransferase [Candidatus Acidiferrales bacterium]